jgi:hypothetical protein
MKKFIIFTTISIYLCSLTLAQEYDRKQFTNPKSIVKSKISLNDFTQPENNSVSGNMKDYKSAQVDFGDPPDWNWVEQFGGSSGDYARDIVTDESGNIFIAGSFSDIFKAGSTWYTSIGERDAFIAKILPDGVLSWFKQYSPQPGKELDFYGIAMDETGNLYITGFYSGSITIAGYNLPDILEKNLLLVRFDPLRQCNIGSAPWITG